MLSATAFGASRDISRIADDPANGDLPYHGIAFAHFVGAEKPAFADLDFGWM